MSDFNLAGLESALGDLSEEQQQNGKLLQEQGIISGEYLAEFDPFEIEIDKDQPRKKVSDEWISELAGLINTNGLEQFPVVEMVDDKPLHRIGMCRILSYRKLQEQYPDETRFKKIPVVVREYKERDGMSKVAVVRIGQLIENKGRLNPDPIDEAGTVAELVKEIGRDKLIEQFNEQGRDVSQSWVTKRIKLAECEADVVKDCMDAGVVDIEARILLNRLYKADQDAYYALMDQVNDNEIQGSVREAAKKAWKAFNDNAVKEPVINTSEHSGVGSVVDRLPNENADYDDKQTSKKPAKKPVEVQDDAAPEQEESEGSTIIVEVDDVVVSGNQVTLIVDDNEPNYAFTLPDGMTIEIKREN